MSRRILALTTIPLAAALFAAGCSQSTDTTAQAPSTTAPSTTAPPTTAPAPTAPTKSADATVKPTRTATATRDGSGGGAGAGATRIRLADATSYGRAVPTWVKPCPYPEQKPVVLTDHPADVTGDGVEDLLIVRSCTAITSYWATSVEVFDGTSPLTKPKRIGTLLTDSATRMDGPYIYGLKVTKGVVELKAHGVDSKTDNACPNQTFTYRYEFSKGAFHLTQRKVGPRMTGCPQIGG